MPFPHAMPNAYSHLEIETTQHVNLQYEIAGIGRRFIAAMLDTLLIWSYIVAFVYVLDRTGRLDAWMDFQAAYYVYLFIILPVGLYHPVCELLFGGKSIGKMIMGLRVVQMDGSPLRLGNIILRWMFRLVEVMLTSGSIGTWAIILTAKSQRLGDMAANTIVVVENAPVALHYDFQLDLPPNYQVQFPQVANLTDEDIQLISAAYEKTYSIQNETITFALASQLRKVLHIQTKIADTQLIETVLMDYQKIYGA